MCSLCPRLLALVFFLFLFCNSSRCCAQSDSSASPQSSLCFQYDNDFFAATDRYYTQGVFLRVAHRSLRISPFFYVLPGRKNASTKFEVTAEQEVYTPRSIRYKGGAIYEGERPFTAFFLLSHATDLKNQRTKSTFRTQFDIGVMGPVALGEEEQKAIHKALDNIEPLGWENQLSQSFLINYRAGAQKTFLRGKNLDLSGNLLARIGSLYTDLSTGITCRLGIFDPLYILAENNIRKKFECYMIINAMIKGVGYNATLQGGLFEENNKYELPDNSISRVVANLSAGIVVRYKKMELSFIRYYVTPEFDAGTDHSWGSVRITGYLN